MIEKIKITGAILEDDYDVSIMIGKTFDRIDRIEKENWFDYNDGLLFTTTEGEKYLMIHDQDCCESVYIEDIEGDLTDLIGSPILKAEEVKNDQVRDEYGGTHTWTFYKFATVKGYVTIRWHGESNGYYSEEVGFYKI